ncbi:MAG: type I-A CRISPR-associated protein Cas4/Csa1 [Acidilobaceae archaeon]
MIGHSLRRALRTLHEQREHDPVPIELRGWSWDRFPVRPRARLGLAVSDIAYGYRCGWRLLWFKKKYGITPQVGPAAQLGREVHDAFRSAMDDVLKLSISGRPWDIARLLATAERRFSWKVAQLYKRLLVVLAGEATETNLIEGGMGAGLPWVSEYRVDGWPLGLSRQLRVDAMGDAGIVLEIKTGRRGRWQEVAITGYAMAFESFKEVPVDYGILLNVNMNNGITVSADPIYISPDLRREFLNARDEAIDALLSEEEPPETGCGEEE